MKAMDELFAGEATARARPDRGRTTTGRGGAGFGDSLATWLSAETSAPIDSREPSARLHTGSSFSSGDPPYAPVSKTGTTSVRYSSWELTAESPDIGIEALNLHMGSWFPYEYDLKVPWEHAR